jgi:hypothetical protein
LNYARDLNEINRLIRWWPILAGISRQQPTLFDLIAFEISRSNRLWPDGRSNDAGCAENVETDQLFAKARTPEIRW